METCLRQAFAQYLNRPLISFVTVLAHCYLLCETIPYLYLSFSAFWLPEFLSKEKRYVGHCEAPHTWFNCLAIGHKGWTDI